MIDDFLIRAALGGSLVALASGPIGTLLIWQRLTQIGAGLASATLLGAGLGLAFNISPALAALAVALLVALALSPLIRESRSGTGPSWELLIYGALATALIALALLPGQRPDVMAYLFGNLLSQSWSDILLIGTVSLGAIAVLGAFWSSFLRVCANSRLAAAEGIKVERLRLILLICAASLIGVAMQVLGALLLMALLLIPATAARLFARSPEQMALIASLLGTTAVLSGLGISMSRDLPTGPSIAASAALIFAVTFAARQAPLLFSRKRAKPQAPSVSL